MRHQRTLTLVHAGQVLRHEAVAVDIDEGLPRLLGLARGPVFRRVVLPLAARGAVPALIGQYVRMLKYTSVASVTGVADLTGSALLVNARIFQPVSLIGGAAAVYFLLCLSLSMTGRALQRRCRR